MAIRHNPDAIMLIKAGLIAYVNRIPTASKLTPKKNKLR